VAIRRDETLETVALALFFVIASIADPVITLFVGLVYICVITILCRARYDNAVLLLPTALFVLTGLMATGIWGIERPVIVMRSAFYISFGPVILWLGMACSSIATQARTYYRAIVYAGFVLSAFYLFRYFQLGPGHMASRYELRDEVGTGYILSALAAALCLVRPREMPWPGMISIGVALIALTSVVFSDSRTNLAATAVMIAAVTVLRPAPRLSASILVLLSILLLVITTPLLSEWLGQGAAGLFHDFGGLRELFAADYVRFSDINTHWRGFEAARAFDFVNGSGGLASLFGMGWGTEVPLHLQIELGGAMMSSIGKFHSIYSQLLVRGGYLGIAMYVAQVWVLAQACARPSAIDDDFRRFGFGLLICAVLAGPAVGGLYAIGGTGAVFALIAGAVAGASLRPLSGDRPQPITPSRQGGSDAVRRLDVGPAPRA